MHQEDARAAPRQGPPRNVQLPAKVTEPRSHATVARPVDELAARRELRSWISAAEWLNAYGYPAAVPGPLVLPLTRRGLSVWAKGGGEAA